MSPIEVELLDKILKDQLRLVDGDIHHYHLCHKVWKVKVPHQNQTNRWKFKFGTKKRTSVYRNRLVWMIHNRSEIPEDCYVDHVDQDKENDTPDNLQLMKISESHRQGNDCQSDRVLDQLSRWFEFVGKHDREPETIEEESFVECGF